MGDKAYEESAEVLLDFNVAMNEIEMIRIDDSEVVMHGNIHGVSVDFMQKDDLKNGMLNRMGLMNGDDNLVVRLKKNALINLNDAGHHTWLVYKHRKLSKHVRKMMV